MTNNEFRIDQAGNPQVAEFFSDKKIGDTCEITVTGKVKSNDPKGEVVLAIDKLSYDEDGEATDVSPGPDTPMQMAMKPMGSDEGDE